MWNDREITISNLYGMASPDPKYMKDRIKRVQVVIERMGETYCLAKQVVKKNAGSKT